MIQNVLDPPIQGKLIEEVLPLNNSRCLISCRSILRSTGVTSRTSCWNQGNGLEIDNQDYPLQILKQMMTGEVDSKENKRNEQIMDVSDTFQGLT